MGLWSNSPSTTTPISATNLGRMEKYTTATAGSNGDFYVNFDGASGLASGDLVHIIFPAATDNTKNARLSINNGTNYYTIKDSEGNTMKSSYVENMTNTLYFDGTYFVLDVHSQPIVVLFSGTSSIGSAITLSENVYNFSSIIVKCGNAGIYMIGPVVKWFSLPSSIIAGGFQPSSVGQFACSILFTVSNSGMTLTSNTYSNFINISTTPTVVKTLLNNVTNIWGVR